MLHISKEVFCADITLHVFLFDISDLHFTFTWEDWQPLYAILQEAAIIRAGIILVICKSILQQLEETRSVILEPWVIFCKVFFCNRFREAAGYNIY